MRFALRVHPVPSSVGVVLGPKWSTTACDRRAVLPHQAAALAYYATCLHKDVRCLVEHLRGLLHSGRAAAAAAWPDRPCSGGWGLHYWCIQLVATQPLCRICVLTQQLCRLHAMPPGQGIMFPLHKRTTCWPHGHPPMCVGIDNRCSLYVCCSRHLEAFALWSYLLDGWMPQANLISQGQAA